MCYGKNGYICVLMLIFYGLITIHFDLIRVFFEHNNY